jgi:hypothetical protein
MPVRQTEATDMLKQTFIIGSVVAFLALATGSIEIHSTLAQAGGSNDGSDSGGSVMPGSMVGVNPAYHKDIFGSAAAAGYYGFGLTPAQAAPGPQARVVYKRPVTVAHKNVPTRLAAASPVPKEDRCNLGSSRCENKDRDGGSGKLIRKQPPRYVCQGVTLMDSKTVLDVFCHFLQG